MGASSFVCLFFFLVFVGAGILYHNLTKDCAKVGGAGDIYMSCKNCGANATVSTEQVKRKKGISGGKATAAILTNGVSVGVVGLSRKEQETKASCSKCKSVWYF